MSQCCAGVLGQLVHIDDMNDRAQFVQMIGRPLVFPPRFERREKEYGRTHQHQDVDQRLDTLQNAEKIVAAVLELDNAADVGDQPETDDNDGGNSQPHEEVGTGDDISPPLLVSRATSSSSLQTFASPASGNRSIILR